MSPFFHSDPELTGRGEQLLAATWAQFPWLEPDQLALTWLVYNEPVPVNTGGALSAAEFWRYPISGFAHRGDRPIYPASVVKLFYLVACHEWLQTGMLSPSAELERGMQDMIVSSSNDATGLVVDMLTGTTSGPELAAGPFATWQYQRNIVNRYFQSLDWPELVAVNLNQKTWCEGPYGREKAFLGPDKTNRNALTTDATARLLHSIVGGVAVSSPRSQAMMSLLQRSLDPEVLAADPENQVTGFLAEGLPPGSQVWSKAGWTSQVRHDAAYLEIPGQQPNLLVVFTEGRQASQATEVLPFIAEQVVAATLAVKL
jgi:Beta-lactamase enzyme family